MVAMERICVMPFNDDADAPLVVDDDSDWRPVFGAHTPLDEVVALAAIEADRVYRETLVMLAADGVQLSDAARATLATFIRERTQAAFLTGYTRLKGADA